MRAVFDTNVIIAGLVASGLCAEILESHLPQQKPILSRWRWDELGAKLTERFGLVPAELPLLALYRRHATWVEPAALDSPACHDSDDDRVLATAIAGEAEVVVTGARDLLDLGSYEGIRILTPRQWLGGA